MSDSPAAAGRATAQAVRELVELQQQAEAVQVQLTHLQEDVIAVESQRLDAARSSALVEANEQLVAAALRAHTNAEIVERELNQAMRSAEHDALTELPNRVLLLDRFAHAMALAKRHKKPLALLFLDLNDFKQINDTYGHGVGDEVLKQVSHALVTSVRAADTVSRHGGDEFLILLAEMTQPADAAQIAAKMLAAVAMPKRVGEQELHLSASIGISIYPDDGVDFETLIERADAAMYAAKRGGVRSFQFHGQQPADAPGSSPETTPAALPQYPLALTELESRHALMREANEQLVLAALDARQLQAVAELKQKRQTEFLAVLAHELRNPLMPISTAAALLAHEGDGDSESILPQVQGVIERQVRHISRLLDDVFDAARVNTGKFTLKCENIDLAGVFDAAIEGARPAMEARRQQLRVQLPEGALSLYGDAVRLTQVFSNLLDNASKYTPNGGAIEFAVTVVDATVVITLTDSGIGITAAAMPHIFELFAQDMHAVDFDGLGLGIGLTVVRELVAAHGGSVSASSPGAGLGSRFVVTLPLAEQSS